MPDFAFPSSQNLPKQHKQPPPYPEFPTTNNKQKPTQSPKSSPSPNTSGSSLPASFHQREGEVSGGLQPGRAAPGVGSAPRLRTAPAPAPPPRPFRLLKPRRPQRAFPGSPESLCSRLKAADNYCAFLGRRIPEGSRAAGRYKMKYSNIFASRALFEMSVLRNRLHVAYRNERQKGFFIFYFFFIIVLLCSCIQIERFNFQII